MHVTAGVVGATGALTGGFAAPSVVVAGLHAIGFGTGGIGAGTIAAGTMSSAAIANGGGVVAGGVIATAQSIGATGTLAYMAVPALVPFGGAILAGGACAGAVYGGWKLAQLLMTK